MAGKTTTNLKRQINVLHSRPASATKLCTIIKDIQTIIMQTNTPSSVAYEGFNRMAIQQTWDRIFNDYKYRNVILALINFIKTCSPVYMNKLSILGDKLYGHFMIYYYKNQTSLIASEVKKCIHSMTRFKCVSFECILDFFMEIEKTNKPFLEKCITYFYHALNKYDNDEIKICKNKYIMIINAICKSNNSKVRDIGLYGCKILEEMGLDNELYEMLKSLPETQMAYMRMYSKSKVSISLKNSLDNEYNKHTSPRTKTPIFGKIIDERSISTTKIRHIKNPIYNKLDPRIEPYKDMLLNEYRLHGPSVVQQSSGSLKDDSMLDQSDIFDQNQNSVEFDTNYSFISTGHAESVEDDQDKYHNNINESIKESCLRMPESVSSNRSATSIKDQHYPMNESKGTNMIILVSRNILIIGIFHFILLQLDEIVWQNIYSKQIASLLRSHVKYSKLMDDFDYINNFNNNFLSYGKSVICSPTEDMIENIAKTRIAKKIQELEHQYAYQIKHFTNSLLNATKTYSSVKIGYESSILEYERLYNEEIAKRHDYHKKYLIKLDEVYKEKYETLEASYDQAIETAQRVFTMKPTVERSKTVEYVGIRNEKGEYPFFGIGAVVAILLALIISRYRRNNALRNRNIPLNNTDTDRFESDYGYDNLSDYRLDSFS